MRILFALFSFFYIAAIFILAGTPVVHTLSEFNPYSLLHIPLYGIMTFLLVFSMIPISREFKFGATHPGSDSTTPRSRVTADRTIFLLVAGGIAWVVGIFDEVHQLYVPGRDASVGDVALDTVGVGMALLLCYWFFKRRGEKAV